MKVALVEDCARLRRLMGHRLEEEAISIVAQAATEGAALIAIALSAPDVVLVDLSLEHGSGLGVISGLRSRGFTGLIFVLSARERARYEALVMAIGADGFFDKSSDFELLILQLRSLLHSGRSA